MTDWYSLGERFPPADPRPARMPGMVVHMRDAQVIAIFDGASGDLLWEPEKGKAAGLHVIWDERGIATVVRDEEPPGEPDA